MTDMSLVRYFAGVRADEAGHRFRGEFLDLCGRVERWLAAILALPKAPARGCDDRTPLGTRLKAVRAIAESDCRSKTFLNGPQKVIKLLDRFQPYAELRSVLAHSTQTVCFDQAGGLVFLYGPVGESAHWSQIALTEAAQKRVLGCLRALAKEFDDQRPVAR
jgi:hypothetical protein